MRNKKKEKVCKRTCKEKYTFEKDHFEEQMNELVILILLKMPTSLKLVIYRRVFDSNHLTKTIIYISKV